MCLMINVVFTVLILFVGIDSLVIIENPSPWYGRFRRAAVASATEVFVQCFSSDSLIKLSNGKEKEISSLKSGDEIITIDEKNLISTEMILMLDKQISKKALFYTLKTESGNKISLTEYHLIPIKSSNENLNYLFAKQIQIGDYLLILSNNKIEYSPVINITIEIKNGYYAPLTIKGTLLVNHILASCFAYVKNHHLAQFSMFPLRFYYKLTKFIYLNEQFSNEKSEGLHWIVSIMFHLTRYFRPQTFILP